MNDVTVQDMIDRALAKAGILAPLRVTNPQIAPVYQMGDLQWGMKLIRLAPPLLRPQFDERGNPITYSLDDPQVIAKIRHTMRPDEKMSAWFARTLIGRAEIFRLSKAELAARVKLADSYNREQGIFQ